MTRKNKYIALTILFTSIFIESCDLFLPETHMGNGYYFVTINTINRYIFRKIDGVRQSIVDPNIVASARIQDYSFSLRQPAVFYEENSVSNVRFLNECEFYIIDIHNAVVYGPLDINGFKKKTRDIGVCDRCLYENTKDSLSNYCVDRADISSLFIKK